MSRWIPLLLPFICLFMVVLEGTFSLMLQQTPLFGENWHIISHWLLLFLLYVAIFFDRENTYYALAFAIIFGVIVDIVYTDIIGVYLFAYAAVIYLIKGFMRLLHANFFVAILLSLFGIVVTDISVYFLYNIIQAHQDSWSVYWQTRLIPTVCWNLLISILFYFLFAKRLTKWAKVHFDQKD